jgi:hypothetical protein
MDALARSFGRPLIREEIHLSLEQERHLGEIADNVVRSAGRGIIKIAIPSRHSRPSPRPCPLARWPSCRSLTLRASAMCVAPIVVNHLRANALAG